MLDSLQVVIISKVHWGKQTFQIKVGTNSQEIKTT